MEPLPETIKIRVSCEDKAAFEAIAERDGMSLSTWCRVALKASWREGTGTTPTIGNGSKPSDLVPPPQIDLPNVINGQTRSLIEKVIERPMEIYHWSPHEIDKLVRPDCKLYVAHYRGQLIGVIVNFVKHINGDSTMPVFSELTTYPESGEFYEWIEKRVPGARRERFPEHEGEIKLFSA